MTKAMREARIVTHVHLANWRNFQQAGVDLQRRAFLIGPNASGKSNFLDAFRFLRDIASVGGGFQHAVARRNGVSQLRCLAARRYPDIALSVDIGTADEPRQWHYELAFKQESTRTPLITRERVIRDGERVLNRPDQDDRADPALLSQTHLEQVNANREFRDVAEFFSTIRYLHIVPQLMREPERSVGRTNDPYGGDFLERIASTNQNTQAAWLRRITQALEVAVPQLDKLELSRDNRGTPHLRGRYKHWRPHGQWQSEEAFSDGTLRLLGLLWSLLEGAGPLLLEEPELSLHAEIVRHVPRMFHQAQGRTGRQILVSTHSPELLRDEGIGLDEVLILKPHSEGTSVYRADTVPQLRSLVEGGVPLSEAVVPYTAPEGALQLSLFGG
jgi:predicted ATPase